MNENIYIFVNNFDGQSSRLSKFIIIWLVLVFISVATVMMISGGIYVGFSPVYLILFAAFSSLTGWYMWFRGYSEFIQAIRINDDGVGVFGSKNWQEFKAPDIETVRVMRFYGSGARIILHLKSGGNTSITRFRVVSRLSANAETELDRLEQEVTKRWPDEPPS